MERVAQVFASHEEADRATREFYQSLTPAKRLEILLEILARARANDDDAKQGLARVYRIVKLPQG
jgi:hypothetical protein